MKRQKLLKNLNSKGRYLALLLTVFASFAVNNTASAAFDARYNYYFDNAVTKWSEVWMIIGHDSWSQAIQMAKTDSEIYKTIPGWGDAKKYYFADSDCGYHHESYQEAFGSHSKTGNCTETYEAEHKNKMCTPTGSTPSGTNISCTWETPRCPKSVLKGDYIMFYIGEPNGWNQQQFQLTVGSNGSVIEFGREVIENNDSKDWTNVCAPKTCPDSKTYYVRHQNNDYAGSAIESGHPKAGMGYYNDNSNHPAGSEYTATITLGSSSIEPGSNVSFTSTKSDGNFGTTTSLKVYATLDNENFTELTINGSTLTTSSLETGTWTIIPVCYDGWVYVKGTTTTLTVAPAGTAPTVLLGAQATVTGSTADLYGYLKFTGCQNVTDFGFIWSDTEANISATTPTGTSVQASSPAAPIEVGHEGQDFSKTGYLFQTSATKVYYKAYATNSVGTSYSDEYRELSITGCVKPDKPGDITGAATACKTIASAYSVAEVATATSYKWSLPEGWSITSGSGTRSITATPGDDAVAGDIKVCATNECGDGEYSNNFAVAVNPLAVAGTVSLSPNSICYGDDAPTVSVTDYVLGGGTGAWSSSNPEVATINADGTNLTIVGVGSTNITYTITGGCGGTKSADASLTVNAVPVPGTVSATETTICADGTSTLSAQGTTAGVSYQWQKSTTDGMTGFEDITGATEQTYTISGLAAGTYWFRLKVTNDADCNNISNAEQITVNANPSIILAGSGDKGASATTPWEYMTITATTDFTPAWSLTTPAGFEENTDYVVETGAKTYKLKSKLTDNPDTDKFTVSATVTDSGCSTTVTYDVYINAADIEICN